jgi:hypothetical protein
VLHQLSLRRGNKAIVRTLCAVADTKLSGHWWHSKVGFSSLA